MKRFLIPLFSLAALVLAFGGPASAAFPEKPIKLIVSHGAGGSSDLVCRILAKYLEPILGQPIVIVNVSGGGGAVGFTQLMNSKPDGYTVGEFDDSMSVLEATGAVKFTHHDFDPITMFGTMVNIVFTKGKGGKYASLSELKADAEARPGKVSFAMGYGTPSQFVAKLFEDAFGVDMNLVNVGGGAKRKAAILGAHIDAGINTAPDMVAPHNSGQLKILGVLDEKRLSTLPDVATAREQGVDALNYLAYGLLAPKGVPADRAKVISDAVAKLANDAGYQEAIRKVSFKFVHKNPADWAKQLEVTRQRTLKIGKSLGF